MNPEIILKENDSQQVVVFPYENWASTGIVIWELNLEVIQFMVPPRKNEPYSKTSKKSFYQIGNTMNRVFKERGWQVTLQNIKIYLDEMKDRVKPNTYNTAKNAIKQITLAQPIFQSNYLLRKHIKDFFRESFHSVKIVRNMNEDKYLSYGDYEKLVAFGRDENNVPLINTERKRWGHGRWEEQVLRNYKMSLMIEALFQTASRVSAFLNIRLSDCSFTHDGLYKIFLLYDKGQKNHEVYIKEDLAREIHRTFKPKVYLFENERGRKIHRSNFAKQLEDYAEAAGLKEHVHPHKLRHTYAMARIYGKNAKNGGRSDVTAKDVQDVAIYLSHSDVSTTYKYYLNKQINRRTIHDIPE